MNATKKKDADLQFETGAAKREGEAENNNNITNQQPRLWDQWETQIHDFRIGNRGKTSSKRILN